MCRLCKSARWCGPSCPMNSTGCRAERRRDPTPIHNLHAAICSGGIGAGKRQPSRLSRGGVRPLFAFHHCAHASQPGEPGRATSPASTIKRRPSTARTDRLLNITCLLASFTPLPRRSDDREEEPPCKKQSAQDEFHKVSHSVQQNDRHHQDNSDQSHDFHVAHPAG